MKNRAQAFDDADEDGNEELDFDEWVAMLPAKTRNSRTQEQLRDIFKVADINGNGVLSLDEFFLWSLSLASMTSGADAESAFSKFDTNGDGRLNELEFTRVAEHMGMGDYAHELFAQLPKDSNRTISYRELLKQVGDVEYSREMKGFLMATAWESGNVESAVQSSDFTAGWTFHGDDVESTREALRALLKEHDARLIHVVRQLLSICSISRPVPLDLSLSTYISRPLAYCSPCLPFASHAS